MNPLNLAPLANEEFNRFFEQILACIDTGATPMPAALAAAKTGVQQRLTDIDALYKRDRASQLTRQLVAIDATRDAYIRGIALVCEGYTSHPDAAVRDAAARLDRALTVYGPGIAKQNYQKETTIIQSFVADCRQQPELTAAVATLNLGCWIDALDAENKAFDQKFLERNALDADMDLPYTMIGKRRELKTAYENLLHKLMGFYHTAEGAEPWAGMVKQVEGLTEEYRGMMARRKGRKEEKES